METTEVHGLRIAYERAGDGPPLVLLHGYVGDGPTTWRPQLEGLGDELTMIAWDAPGAGRSSDPPESFGMTGYADCLAGFVERLGLEHPARGRAVVRWRARPGPLPPPGRPAGDPDPGVRGRRLGRLPARRGHRPASPAGDGAGRPATRRVRRHLLPTMFSEATPPESVDAFGASMLGFHPVGFRAMARASAENLRDALPDVTVPTLLVYGDQDVRPLSVAEDLHRSIPGSTWLSCPTPATSATWRPRRRSTRPSGASSTTSRGRGD
jgi:pimeloyl-ACP methyl ester carboxylesterase